MTHVTVRLTAKNRDQLRNPTLGKSGTGYLNLLKRTYVQFLCLVAIGEADFNVGQVAPVRSRSQRNILHASMDQRAHLLADVVTQDWLILTPTDLTKTNIKYHFQ